MLIKRKKTRWTWYQLLRVAGQLSYAALTVLAILGNNLLVAGILMGSALIGGAFFCGWLCPLGTVQEWIGRLGSRLFRGKRLQIPSQVEKWLFLMRYVLLISGVTGFMVLTFLSFLSRPYQTFMGLIVGQTAYVSVLAWTWLGLFLVGSLIMDRPFCRYFCTEGAKYGLLSLARVFSIKRDEVKCIDCGLCDRACPTQVKISTRGHVLHPQCINCMECISACPVDGALTYGFAIRRLKKKTEIIDDKTA